MNLFGLIFLFFSTLTDFSPEIFEASETHSDPVCLMCLVALLNGDPFVDDSTTRFNWREARQIGWDRRELRGCPKASIRARRFKCRDRNRGGDGFTWANGKRACRVETGPGP